MGVRATVAAAAAFVLLSGCGSDTAGSAGDAVQAAGQPAGAEAAPAPAGAADYIEQLHADSLHPGIAPAEPGTAYIEVGGQRFDFATVKCSVSGDRRGESFDSVASDDSAGVGHHLYVVRRIGPNTGWAWEDEHVQLALLTTPAGAGSDRARFSNSMTQQNREQGEAPVWLSGSGQSPLVRVVGTQATATGTLKGLMLADSPLEGDFIAALTCPD